MNPVVVGFIILLMLVIGISSGAPLAFVLGGVAIIASFLFWGPVTVYAILSNAFGIMDNFVLVAVPMFIFMAFALEKSGIVEDMYNAVYKWSGPLRGGLAVATVLACTILAACTGVASAGIITMGIIALPQMLAYGYEKKIAMGAVLAGGTLGPLIPPSVLIVLYGATAQVSVGQMFAGSFPAGLILSSLFNIYILIRSYLQRGLCPALPREERASLHEKIVSLRHLILPAFLIIGVLGSIFSGAATPTEASAIGAIGALICAAVKRVLNWRLIYNTGITTIKYCGMIGWLVIGCTGFSTTFMATGGEALIKEILMILGFGTAWGSLIVVFIMLFIMGMLLDPTAIIFIGAPLFCPVVASFGFDMLWFAVMFMLLLQTSFLSPPFGYGIFYLVSVLPKNLTLSDVYKAALPFVGIQLIGIIICIIWPQTILWLPNVMFR